VAHGGMTIVDLGGRSTARKVLARREGRPQTVRAVGWARRSTAEVCAYDRRVGLRGVVSGHGGRSGHHEPLICGLNGGCGDSYVSRAD